MSLNFTLNWSFCCKTSMISTSNPDLQPGLMYGSAMRAQNRNVQFGKTFGIFDLKNHICVKVLRPNMPFWQVSNRVGRKEPTSIIISNEQKKWTKSPAYAVNECGLSVIYRNEFYFDKESLHKCCTEWRQPHTVIWH